MITVEHGFQWKAYGEIDVSRRHEPFTQNINGKLE